MYILIQMEKIADNYIRFVYLLLSKIWLQCISNSCVNFEKQEIINQLMSHRVYIKVQQ